jgi:hypothetical protein
MSSASRAGLRVAGQASLDAGHADQDHAIGIRHRRVQSGASPRGGAPTSIAELLRAS